MELSLDIDVSHFVDFCSNYDHNSFRHHDHQTFKKKICKDQFPYKYSRHFRFHRILDSWNILPVDIRTAHCAGN